MLKSLRRALSFLVVAFRDFVFPPVCLGCEKNETEHGLVCADCLDRLSLVATSEDITRPLPDVDHVRALGSYTLPRSSLVHELKYRNRQQLAPVLGWALARLVLSDALLKSADRLVPVPLHPARHRERGYNQSELLTREVSRLTGISWSDALRRVKNTSSQVSLRDDKARARNMEDAFRAQSDADIKGMKVVLVDDVSTTGATLGSAAQALRNAGASQVYALVVARRGRAA
jgi:ComF family protein